MNKMILFFAATLSLSAIAQDRPTNLERIERRTEEINDLVMNERRHLNLSRHEQEVVLNQLNEVISTIRGSSMPRPPRPVPYPFPELMLEVTAVVENKLLSMSGRSKADIFNICMSQAQNKNVDNITIVTNNSKVRNLKTGGWWNGPGDICSVIMENIVTDSTIQSQLISAYGTFEDRSFNIRANSKADALSQCATAHGASKISYLDDISVGVGNAPIRKLRTGGWWKNASEACHQVMMVIDSVIP